MGRPPQGWWFAGGVECKVRNISAGKRGWMALGAALAMITVLSGAASSAAGDRGPAASALSDQALARSLPGGFRNGYAQVNGVRLHYVAGGRGAPLVLLPGWPQTWWSFHKIMPALAVHRRVIAVDLRGMGGSSKAGTGYDKKTAAADIYALVRQLGYRKADIAGHDIGAMVAFSFAVNHPDATRTVSLLNVTHPDARLYELPMIPQPGAPNLWWFAFNQLQGLPEQLLTGRSRYLVDTLVSQVAENPKAIAEHDRRVYAKAYSYPAAIRAGNGWYQAFGQDIKDAKSYGKVTAPMLGLGGDFDYSAMLGLLKQGTRARVEKVGGSGHFLPEEQPQGVVQALTRFLG